MNSKIELIAQHTTIVAIIGGGGAGTTNVRNEVVKHDTTVVFSEINWLDGGHRFQGVGILAPLFLSSDNLLFFNARV